MKKFFLLLATVLVVFPFGSFSQTPIFYDNGKYFGVNAGFKHSSLNAGTFNIGYIEGTCYPSPTAGWEFSTRIEYGKDYFSFEPVSAVGFLLMLFTQSRAKQFDSGQKLIAVISAVSSAKFPIYIWDWLEAAPYWNLMKLTKLYDSNLKIHGEVGGQIKFYPCCNSYSVSTLYISPFINYDFGYKKNAGDFMSESWGHHIEKADKSPFHGFSYGIQVGMYF